MNREHVVYTRRYAPPPWRQGEILRYAGVRGEAPELAAPLEECLREAEGVLDYRIAYCKMDARAALDWLRTPSADLQKNLAGCDHVVLFAATVGIGIDRLIARYAPLSPTKALLFQAIGAERIESLCDTFQGEIAAEMVQSGRKTRPRFSPGYGDFPLEAQKDIFTLLDCPRRIGLTLNESLLMSPSKSVTAIIGARKL